MSYLQLVEKYITKPLGMNDTKMTLSAKQMKRFPKGFDEQGNETSYWDIPSFTAAGALRSTTYDMAKYLKANLEAKTSAIKLSQKTTFISNDNTVGMLWGIGKTLSEEVTIGHNGGTGGYKSKIQMLPSRGIGLVILSNSSVDITEMGYELQLRLTK
jgi:CubicO group peptidase (beta-lactamase class C family)